MKTSENSTPTSPALNSAGTQPATTPLRANVKAALQDYLEQADVALVTDLYALVLAEVEAPMLEVVLQKVRHNQCKAAKLLGINRGTLRTKLKQYDLLD
jgi:Fis family transcriptional regulator, factor for inversion stimulation protein